MLEGAEAPIVGQQTGVLGCLLDVWRHRALQSHHSIVVEVFVEGTTDTWSILSWRIPHTISPQKML